MPKKKIQLLAIGDSCIDQYMKVEEGYAEEENHTGKPEICFFHGSKIPVSSFHTSIAGNAVNVSVGTASLGLNTAVYTEIGDDENAEKILGGLKEKGVSIEFCHKNPETQTDVHPIVSYMDDRTIFIFHEKRDYRVGKWPLADWIYYSSIGKNFLDFQKELTEYLKKNTSIGVIFNPGTYHLKAGVESLQDILQVTHVLIVNKDESEQLSGIQSLNPVETHKALQKLGPKLTVITDAANGASAYDGQTLSIVPAYPDKRPIADTTGAGDAFSSGFISAISYGKSLKEALRWGIINSSGVIRIVGAINGLRSREEIERIIKEEL